MKHHIHIYVYTGYQFCDCLTVTINKFEYITADFIYWYCSLEDYNQPGQAVYYSLN